MCLGHALCLARTWLLFWMPQAAPLCCASTEGPKEEVAKEAAWWEGRIPGAPRSYL